MCSGVFTAAGSHPDGPGTDLVWASGEEVLQLQGRIARLDDLAQGTGGEKFHHESKVLNRFVILR